MRWRVQLCQRSQAPDPNGPGIVETITPIATVHADIRPVGLQTFIGAEQIETPVTHRITIRWRDYTDLNTFNIVQRVTELKDYATQRTETFRVRRMAEWQGRKRFLIIDAELESFAE